MNEVLILTIAVIVILVSLGLIISLTISGFIFNKLVKEVPHRSKNELGIGSFKESTNVNTFKQLRYTFSELDTENPNVLKLKKRLRKYVKIELFLVGIFILILVISKLF